MYYCNIYNIIIIQQLLKTPKAELCFNYHKEEEKEEEEEEESLRINLFDFFLKFGGIYIDWVVMDNTV